MDYLEVVAEMAEKCDNLWHAAELPLPPEVHVEQLRRGLLSVRDALREVYIRESGEDPWGVNASGTDTGDSE